jgi:uncharacterized protein (TIGR02001 family)
LRALIAALCLAGASPAAAQVGATLSVFSQANVRGYSVSNGHPVAAVDFSYDDSSGAYAAASATGVASSSDLLRPLSLQLNGGYARPLSSSLTLDVGATGSIYSHYSQIEAGRTYGEIYASLLGKNLSSRISFSPDYFLTGGPTLYGELNGNFGRAYGLRFEGHLGALVALDGGSTAYRRQIDWRLGVTRELGRVALHAAWAGRGRAPRPFGTALRTVRSANALILGITYGL